MDNVITQTFRTKTKRLFGGDDDEIDYWYLLEWIIFIILVGAAILRFS
jgi:hypothetical protein